MIIVLVGMCGSGKSTVCEYLIKKGFKGVYFGQVSMDWLHERNMSITPHNEKIAQLKIREQYGNGGFAILAMDKIKSLLIENNLVYIDGLYSTEEYEILINEIGKGDYFNINNSIVLLEVYSDKSVRYKRLNKRIERSFNMKECVERDWTEIKQLNKGGPIALSDYKIDNNGDKEKLYKNIDVLFNRLSQNF